MKTGYWALKLIPTGSLALLLMCSAGGFAQETAILDWAKRTGGTGADRSRDMVADAAGNVYTT
ncbi:MAG TPA: hypothetical protein PLF59_14300, partial [Cyclobacteriaceae bacterium]|nr:hypothetical protein [Cyclobacteriaceae bacterium]